MFDGHGSPSSGHECSQLLSLLFVRELTRAAREHADACRPGAAAAAAPRGEAAAAVLRRVVADLEEKCLDVSRKGRVYHGSTLCAAVVPEGSGVVVTANVGDSRAVLASGEMGDGGAVKARDLTKDHVPTDADERRRIELAGGWVTSARMLNGYIGMSRALGDNDLKEHRNLTEFPQRPARCRAPFRPSLFCATPDVVVHALEPADHFVLLATDGVWHVMDSQGAVDVVVRALRAGKNPGKELYQAALRRGANDNITVVVVPVSREARRLVDAAGGPRVRGRGRVRNRLRAGVGAGGGEEVTVEVEAAVEVAVEVEVEVVEVDGAQAKRASSFAGVDAIGHAASYARLQQEWRGLRPAVGNGVGEKGVAGRTPTGGMVLGREFVDMGDGGGRGKVLGTARGDEPRRVSQAGRRRFRELFGRRKVRKEVLDDQSVHGGHLFMGEGNGDGKEKERMGLDDRSVHGAHGYAL